MKNQFFITPIGRAIFTKSTHQKSDQWFKGFLCFGAVFFLGHFVYAVGVGAI